VIELKSKVVDIACGRNNSFAIDENGKLFAWGLNNGMQFTMFTNRKVNVICIIIIIIIIDNNKIFNVDWSREVRRRRNTWRCRTMPLR
jgi:alpha-tubulin suppressor-like RCC1 family protein